LLSIDWHAIQVDFYQSKGGLDIFLKDGRAYKLPSLQLLLFPIKTRGNQDSLVLYAGTSLDLIRANQSLDFRS